MVAERSGGVLVVQRTRRRLLAWVQPPLECCVGSQTTTSSNGACGKLHELQLAMQLKHAILIQPQTLVTEGNTRAQTAEQERADTARIVARIAAQADDGSVIDIQALGQQFKYAGQKESDVAERNRKVRIFLGARFGQCIVDAMRSAGRIQS